MVAERMCCCCCCCRCCRCCSQSQLWGFDSRTDLFSWCLCLEQPGQGPSSSALHRRSAASSARGSSRCLLLLVRAADQEYIARHSRQTKWPQTWSNVKLTEQKHGVQKCKQKQKKSYKGESTAMHHKKRFSLVGKWGEVDHHQPSWEFRVRTHHQKDKSTHLT